MVTIDELKNKIEETGYIATEELIYETFNALDMFSESSINSGQDIYALCLEGPPGAGKTEFAKTYTKLANKMFDGEVELVDYQCDATTGKTELFEDINISAAIRGDADNVNIPGKLIEAIKKVNSGKRVVLFIDEYDKAREETDAFLLQFLQSGKINSTQHGDLEIKEEFKSNLQVILCKNDMREELSGPLSRRIRILRLDYMEPVTFFKVAQNVLVDNRVDKIDDGLLNLVALMYQRAYASKDLYNRLPSCSEMLIALEDADRLMKRANAPQYIIYNTIIKNMFKSLDDIKTFEASINSSTKSEDKNLSGLVKTMKATKTTASSTADINALISQKLFVRESANLTKKVEEMQKLIDEYKVKFAEMEEARAKVIEHELKEIMLANGKLVPSYNSSTVYKNFEDNTVFVKRGANIFEITNEDWVDVANLYAPNLSHSFLIEKMIEFASQMDVIIYENGILLKSDDECNLIVFKDTDENNNSRYRFMLDKLVLPSTYLNDIKNFISLVSQTVLQQKVVPDDSKLYTIAKYSINALIYNDTKLEYESIDENVYSLEFSSEIGENESIDDLNNLVSLMKCSDINNALNSSKKILSSKKLSKVNS